MHQIFHIILIFITIYFLNFFDLLSCIKIYNQGSLNILKLNFELWNLLTWG